MAEPNNQFLHNANANLNHAMNHNAEPEQFIRPYEQHNHHSHATDNGHNNTTHNHAPADSHNHQQQLIGNPPKRPMQPDEDEEAERLHFLKIARTYASYSKEHIGRFVEKRLKDVSKESTAANSSTGPINVGGRNGNATGNGFLKNNFQQQQQQIVDKGVNERHRKILEEIGFISRHAKIEECIRLNQQFLNEVIRDVMHMFQDNNPLKEVVADMDPNGDAFFKYLFSHSTHQALPSLTDHEKMRTTLRQFVRDWAIEGEDERKRSYAPILDEISKRYGKLEDKRTVEVLVPGAGLGRLAFEIASLGYTCQGSEWSVFMLYASSFILNHTLRPKQYTLYPWATQPCNQFSQEKQCKAVQIPDINPRDALAFKESELSSGATPAFSMSAGDFLEVYGNHSCQWDCIASCFFLDTARNVIEYLELMYKMLKPGGCLINLGPLLYHYTDMPGELSIELTYDELVLVIKKVGFDIEKVDYGLESPYLDNQNNLLSYNYKTPLLVALKPGVTPQL